MRASEDYVLFEFRKINKALENMPHKQAEIWALLSMSRLSYIFNVATKIEALEEMSIVDDIITSCTEVILFGIEYDVEKFKGYENIIDPLITICEGIDNDGYGIDYDGEKELVDLFGIILFSEPLYEMCRMFTYLEDGKYFDKLSSMIMSTIMEDYFYDLYPDVYGDDFGRIKEVMAEINRIWADYEFVKQNPSNDEILNKIEAYKKISVIGAVI